MSKLFSFQDLDGHYTIRLFGIKFSIRHKCNFNYKPACEYGVTTEKRSPQLIVSLTSYPGRINTTHLAVNTLLRQSIKPDKVILWLADEQFPNKENDLPNELLKLKEYGLEIKWCEDIRSYKKLIPALKEFPEDIIVTADDDIYYEEDWLESLYDAHKKNPTSLIAQRVRRLKTDNGEIKVVPNKIFMDWDLSKPEYFNQLLGGTGCLYPPHSLYKDIYDYEKAMELLPTNDDIYFWAMAVMNHTKIGVAKGFKGDLYQMDFNSSLSDENVILEKSSNTNPFKIICSEYNQIIDILNLEKENE